MADIKITKAMVLAAIKEIVADDVTIQVGDASVKGTDIIAYCDTTMAQIDAKAGRARKRAAKKKAAGDELRAEVFAHITNELQTADAITAMVEGFEDITKSKVLARLTQLCKNGDIVKEQVKIDNRKQMAYRLATDVDSDED